MTRWTYIAELNQEDPEGSPTPGCWHYAGELKGSDPDVVRREAEALLGGPVPVEAFSPCCDWQDRQTPIVSIEMVREDEGGIRDPNWPGWIQPTLPLEWEVSA